MRRNVRRHTDCDARRAVNQKVGKLRRQNSRLGAGLVIVWHKIHGVVIDIFEHFHCRCGHPGLGVSHRSRWVGVDTAKVALRVNERITHIPFLAHTHQRSVGGLVAVRMVVAAGIAGDFCAFDPPGAGREIQVVHGDQDPPLRRLQTVAHVRQRPADDHAHRVRQIAALELFLDG